MEPTKITLLMAERLGNFDHTRLGQSYPSPSPAFTSNTEWDLGQAVHNQLTGLKLMDVTNPLLISSLYTERRTLLSPGLKKLPHSVGSWPEAMPPMVLAFSFFFLFEIIAV